jgi:uncharacterized protein YlaN (UPF0358 family)
MKLTPSYVEDVKMQFMGNREFENCNTMQEILDECSKQYDLNKELGFATKIIVVSGIKKVVKLIKAEKKEVYEKQ